MDNDYTQKILCRCILSAAIGHAHNINSKVQLYIYINYIRKLTPNSLLSI